MNSKWIVQHPERQGILCNTHLMSVNYELHVAADWYLYCIGCDLLTKIHRTSQTRRLALISELFFRSVNRPLLRITYCDRCVSPLSGVILPAVWRSILVNRTLIQESKLWKRLTAEHHGLVPESALGSYYVIENPNCICLSSEFAYQITDYGRDYWALDSRYPALIGRDFGRFAALRKLDTCHKYL